MQTASKLTKLESNKQCSATANLCLGFSWEGPGKCAARTAKHKVKARVRSCGLSPHRDHPVLVRLMNPAKPEFPEQGAQVKSKHWLSDDASLKKEFQDLFSFIFLLGCVLTLCMPGIFRGWKRCGIPESQPAVSCYGGTGNGTQVLWKHTCPSLAAQKC